MTVGAYAELLFDPNDLSQQALREVRDATAKGDTVKGALERAIFAQRIAVISEARKRLALEQTLTPATVMRVLDYSWQVFAPRFVKIAGPQIALAYGRAFTAAQAGQIDNRYLTLLAEQHARRLGNYFHESSKEALMDGFNTYLNRKVATRAAIDRALVSYGLTRRQTRGLAANTSLDTKVSSPMQIKQNDKSNRYISHSFSTRVSSFAEQEVHNLEMQAEQIAWTWLMEHDQVPKNAEKIWLTARDERTCKVCAPMHGKVVRADDRFVLPNDIKVWVPGVHPNCRCVVRFRVPRQMEIAKADRWDPKEHPRGGDPENRGRFSAANRRGPRFKEPEPELKVDLSGVEQAQREAEQLREIEEILAARTEVAPRQTVAPRQSVQPRRLVAPRTQEVQARTVNRAQVAAREAVRAQVQSRLAARREIDTRTIARQMVARRKIEESTAPKTRELETYKWQIQPLGQKFYSVLDPEEVAQLVLSGKLSFDSQREWVGSEDEAAEEAMKMREQLVSDAFDKYSNKVVEDFELPNFGPDSDEVPYRFYKLQMNPLAASALIHYLDEQGRDHPNDLTWEGDQDELTSDSESPVGDDEVEVDIYDQDEDPAMVGAGEELSIRLDRLAEVLGLTGEDFRVHIAEVETGHASAKQGETEVYAGSTEAKSTAMITGNFELMDSRHEKHNLVDPDNQLDPDDLQYHQVHMDSGGAIPITYQKMTPLDPEVVTDMRIFQPDDE